MFPGALRLTDKRPDNFLYIGLIKQMFPTAKIVNTIRQPLDNCLSVYFQHLDQQMSYALDLMSIGHYYQQYQRLMRHWKTLYGADILDLDYDQLVRAPNPTIGTLLEFCGLPWEDQCANFHQTLGVVRTGSVWQVREQLYQRSSGRWRNYEKHLGQLAAMLAIEP